MTIQEPRLLAWADQWSSKLQRCTRPINPADRGIKCVKIIENNKPVISNRWLIVDKSRDNLSPNPPTVGPPEPNSDPENKEPRTLLAGGRGAALLPAPAPSNRITEILSILLVSDTCCLLVFSDFRCEQTTGGAAQLGQHGTYCHSYYNYRKGQ